MRQKEDTGSRRYRRRSGMRNTFGFVCLVCAVFLSCKTGTFALDRTGGAEDLQYLALPADDSLDYQFADDFVYDAPSHSYTLQDAKGYACVFGMNKPALPDLYQVIDANDQISDRVKTFIKGYACDWLTLYPETDFSNFLLNLRTLKVGECSREEIRKLTGSADALACYDLDHNVIYIDRRIDLDHKDKEDYIIFAHELGHVARGGRHICDNEKVSVDFYDESEVGLYADESLITHYTYELQGLNRKTAYYILSGNYYRIILGCLNDSYTGADYMNHSINYLAEQMDQYMEGTAYERKALYMMALIDAEMNLHYGRPSGESAEALPDLFDYICTMYMRKYLRPGMKKQEAEEVFDDFFREITAGTQDLVHPYTELSKEAFLPAFYKAVKNLP